MLINKMFLTPHEKDFTFTLQNSKENYSKKINFLKCDFLSEKYINAYQSLLK